MRAKFGRFDAADKGAVVAMVLLPRPKPVPEVIVVGVPKVKPVIPTNKMQKIHQYMKTL